MGQLATNAAAVVVLLIDVTVPVAVPDPLFVIRWYLSRRIHKDRNISDGAKSNLLKCK